MNNKIIRSAAAVLGACMLMSSALTVSAKNPIWESTTSRSADGNISISFQEVEVLLPASWSGKCRMVTSDESVGFYQIKSRELWTNDLGFDAGGSLFSICICPDNSYEDWPSFSYLGSTGSGNYVLSFPTDVQAYTDDSSAVAEYNQMYQDLEWIEDHISIYGANTSAPIQDLEGDYILPNSSSAFLTIADLDGMNADEIQMAINEIYARHHRKFVMESVRSYFESKSWYEGTIDPEKFDPNVMNQYEEANINLMVKVMNQR